MSPMGHTEQSLAIWDMLLLANYFRSEDLCKSKLVNLDIQNERLGIFLQIAPHSFNLFQKLWIPESKQVEKSQFWGNSFLETMPRQKNPSKATKT